MMCALSAMYVKWPLLMFGIDCGSFFGNFTKELSHEI